MKARGIETISLVGGHPMLDLVNTVSWRLDPARQVDRLGDLADLLDWSARSRIFDWAVERPHPGAEPEADEVLGQVKRLRELAHEVLTDHLAGRASRPPTQDAVHEVMVRAVRTAAPSGELPMRFAHRPSALAQVPDAVAASMFDLLVVRDLDPLRRCEGDGCGWLYLDRSRNHSRRWCSSADCGNRYRVKQFAARSRGPST